MPEHTIKRFEDELTLLKEKVLSMGGLVEKAIRRAINALTEQNTKKARKVIERDKAINALEVEIDNMTRSLLALRQPAASDLRLVIATIKIVTDLERIGDLAENIAESMLQTDEHPLNHTDSLQDLADRAIAQVQDALDAFARNDVDKAMQVISADHKINRAFKSMQRENLTYMLEDPRQISAGLIASNIGKNIERIGDHAVNVAEMVIYMVRGHDIRHVDHETAAALLNGELDE